MSPKLQKLARFVSENPDATTRMSVEELSAKSGTSVATIYRFCRTLGYKTYSHLKLAIAREIDAALHATDQPDADATLIEKPTLRRPASSAATG